MELNDHDEKMNKDFSRWIEDCCRNCEHKRLFHIHGKRSELADGKYIHGNCNFIVALGGFCGCVEWQSPDNLEYIELMAKRRGLIPEDEKDNK